MFSEITLASAQQSAGSSSEQQMMLFAEMLHQMQMSTPSDTQSTAERILVDLKRSDAAQGSVNNILGERISVNEKSIIGVAGRLADSEKLRVQEMHATDEKIKALQLEVQRLGAENASLSQKLIASETARMVEAQRMQDRLAQVEENIRGEIALKDQAYTSKFDLIDQGSENLERRCTRIEESHRQLKTEVASHDDVKNQQFGGLSHQIADLKRELASHVTAVNARIDSTLAHSEEVRSSTAVNLEQVHTQHAQLQSGIHARFNEMANTCAILSSRIESSAIELQALKNASAATGATLSDLSGFHFALGIDVRKQIADQTSLIAQIVQALDTHQHIYGDLKNLRTTSDAKYPGKYK